MKKLNILLALISALATLDAIAQDSGVSETGIRYNQVGLGYASAKPDDGSSMPGYALNGSVLVSKDIYLAGNYSNVGKSGTTIDRLGLSAGYRVGIASNVDLVAEAGFIRIGYKDSENSVSSTGFDIAAGINAALTPEIQGSIRLNYPRYSSENFSNFNKVTFGGNLAYYITKDIGVSAIYSYNTNVSTMGVGLLYAF